MKKLSLVLSVLLLAACAHTPAQQASVAPQQGRNLSVAYAKEVIVKGKTTGKELLDKVGSPNSIRRRTPGQSAEPAEVWYYWTAPPLQAVAQGGAQPVFRMTVTFDDNAVVKEYTAADGAVVIQ